MSGDPAHIAALALKAQMMNLGTPNAEQLRVTMPQQVDFQTAAGPVTAIAYHAALAPEIRVRRHPDGEHLTAMLVLGYVAPSGPVGFYHAMTAEELERLSEAAWDAAQAVRRHNAGAVPSDAPASTQRGG